MAAREFDFTGFQLDHLSVSQLRTYLMCGLRWWYQNAAPRSNLMEEPGWSARLRGSALDTAANEHYREKAANGTGLSEPRFVEVAVEEHRAGEDTHMFELPEERSRDRVARIAKEYHRSFGAIMRPLSANHVQWKVRHEAPELTVPIVGVIDIETDTLVVVDNKVRGKVPKQADVDRDLQLTTYAMLAGTDAVGLAIITDEANPKPVYVPSRRSKRQIEALRARYNMAAASITAGVLNPAPEGSWYCCEKWCPYWHRCPHGAGENPEFDVELHAGPLGN